MTVAELPLADTLARPLRDLRISVTDRCQFRCTYCMPREIFGRDFVFLPREQLLTFEELARLARIFAGLGVRKLRLTGGEPLLRRDMDKLVAMLAAVDGVQDIALTTNGALLAGKAAALAAAGLRRVTVSLDSLDDAVFMALNDARFPVAQHLNPGPRTRSVGDRHRRAGNTCRGARTGEPPAGVRSTPVTAPASRVSVASSRSGAVPAPDTTSAVRADLDPAPPARYAT